jgi:hypothetical protein
MTHTIPATETRPDDRWAINPAVVFKELDGEMVLLHLDSGVYFGLDPVGTRIWSLLGAGADVRSVCAGMLEEFDVAAAVIEADVLRLIGELRAQNLIVPAEASPAS